MPNRARGLTDAELEEIAVRHLMSDTEHWGYVTEADARAALARMRSETRRVTEEVAHRRVWAEIPGQRPKAVIDLTDPAEVTA